MLTKQDIQNNVASNILAPRIEYLINTGEVKVYYSLKQFKQRKNYANKT